MSQPTSEPAATETLPPVTESTDAEQQPPSPSGDSGDVLDAPLTPLPIDGQSDMAVGEPTIVDVDLSVIRNPSVSATGHLAFVRDDDVCVVEPVVDQQETCWDVGELVDGNSLTWSPDEQQIAATSDVTNGQFQITRLDLATGTAIAIDGGDAEAVEVAPFFDDSGTLRYFRATFGDDGLEAEIQRVDADTAASTGFVTDFLPFGRPVTDGGIVLATSGTPGEGLALLDLADSGSAFVADAPIDAFAYGTPVDVANGVGLVVGREGADRELRAALLDVETSTVTSLNPMLDDDQQLTGVALDPNGMRVAAIVEDRNDPLGHRLLVGEIGTDGSVASFAVVATGEEFAPNGGDPTIRPQGFGDAMEIAWSDGQLTHAVGPLQIVRLPIN